MERELPQRDGELVQKAPQRLRLISEMLSEGKVFMPRKRLAAVAARILATYCVQAGSELYGEDNLREALQLHEQDHRIIVVSNHLSDVDHGVRAAILTRNGYGEFVDQSVHAAGLKMVERLATRVLSYSENRIHMPSPFDTMRLKDALKGANSEAYTENERQNLVELRKLYRRLGVRAFSEAKIHINDQGMHFVLYPEATRSRDGTLLPAQADTAPWFKIIKNAVILPIAIEGGEKIAPPSKIARIYRRIKGRVIIGKPVLAEKVIEFAKRTENPPQSLIDCAMAQVAVLLDPSYIKPQDLTRLRQLKKNLEGYKSVV